MKSTAIFVGVNVAASIPLVFCQQAMAGGETQLSGTADFLKSSLARSSDRAVAKSMLAGDPTFSSSRRPLKINRDLTPTQVLSNPRAVATRNTLDPIGGIKLRPFVPGRKLPSKADLESGFNAMAPQFDNGADPSNLTAGVSESGYMANQAGQGYSTPGYGDYRPSDLRSQNRSRLKDAARVASGYDRRSAPRSMPNQSPSTPGQVGFPCAQQAVADMQPVRGGGGGNEWNQFDAHMRAHGAAPGMQSMGEQMAANDGSDQSAQPAPTAGPAPFPLNLLPEASLKQFIGNNNAPGKRPQPGAPSYFGSWKVGQTPQALASKHNLQPSGFHTYLSSDYRAKGHMLVTSAFKNYVPMAMSSRRTSPNRPVETPVAKHIAQNVQASASVQVATYGPYVSHVAF